MRRVAVIGPTPPCGALSAERFAEMLSGNLGLEAFSLRPLPGLVLAAGGDAPVPWAARAAGDYGASVVQVEADTLIWLRFSPSAYLRDWLAGWLDVFLNGTAGWQRRTQRARLLDVMRACAVILQKGAVKARQLEGLRPQVLLVEFSTPEQALFWLQMQQERARETIPPYA